MSIPIVRPYIFLRCKKCDKKTTHVMISVKTNPERRDEKHEVCECQECGKTKRIIELTS
jgi:hypothetical protein